MCRDLNAATSQEVFAGPYLDDPVEKGKFSAAFMDMTQGFLAFPLCIPGTAVWKGKQGRLYIISVLKKAAARSKIAMQAGPMSHSVLYRLNRLSQLHHRDIGCGCDPRLQGRGDP